MKNIIKSIFFSIIVSLLSITICSFSKKKNKFEEKKYRIISIDSSIGFEYSNLPVDSMFDKNNKAIRSKVYNLNDTVTIYRIIAKMEKVNEKFLLITRKNNINIYNNDQKIKVGNFYDLDLYNAMGSAPITVNCLDFYGQQFCKNTKDSISEIFGTMSLDGIYLIDSCVK